MSDRECSTLGLVCDRTVGACVECASSSDCATGEACRGGSCEAVTPCTSSRMCPGLVCDPTLGYCVECVVDLDCTEPEVCQDGDCVEPPRPCESDRDCTDIGLVCGTGVGHCVECVSDADCTAERYCDASLVCAPDVCGEGQTTCASASEIASCVANGSGYGAAVPCGAGMVCMSSACLPNEVDGGLDDAGGLDAGGLDGGDLDAGALDAGVLDAGIDTGAVDAGVLDAGVLDAGVLDAGVLDAGTSIVAPRPLAPASSSISTSRRPVFRWELAGSTDGARVEVCSDRACATVVATFEAAGTSAAPSADLPSGVVFWRLRGRSGPSVGTAPSATWELFIGRRSAPIATTWGSPLDANGDGYTDVLVGADGARQAYVYFGGPSGIGSSPSRTLLPPGTDGGNFGSTVASIGDVDGDGFGDLAVGAQSYGSGAGRVYVYLGGPSGPSSTPARTLTGTDGPGTNFGAAIASGGDLDRDGYADLVVAAPSAAARAGRVYVFRGSAAGPVTGASTSLVGPDGVDGTFGSSLAVVGDIDGDGYTDLAAGARFGGGGGRAYVYRGGPTGVSAAPSWPLSSPAGGDFSFGLSSAGDVNGDGYVDLVVGAYQASAGEGRAYLYLGGAAGPATTPSTTLAGATGTSYFGSALAGVGDVDGNGYDDVLVGSFGANQALAFGGSPTGLGTSPIATLSGEGGTFALALAGIGDIDRDGYPDACVTAYQYGASETGRAYVYRGSPSATLALARTLDAFSGSGSRFGVSVALAEPLCTATGLEG